MQDSRDSAEREPQAENPAVRQLALEDLAAFRFQDVGSAKPQCLHCGFLLPSMPKARRKCPGCREPIILKHRNTDRLQVIVSTADIERLLLEGLAKDTLREIGAHNASVYDVIARKLSADRGRRPFHLEVMWGTLLSLEKDAQTRGDHGVATSMRYRMSQVQAKAGRFDVAFGLVCQCCYLDMCGPENNVPAQESPFHPWMRSGRSWRRVLRIPSLMLEVPEGVDCSPFPDGLLGDLAEFREQLGLDLKQVQDRATGEAIKLVGYTRGAVKPDAFATELIQELRTFERRNR